MKNTLKTQSRGFEKVTRKWIALKRVVGGNVSEEVTLELGFVFPREPRSEDGLERPISGSVA